MTKCEKFIETFKKITEVLDYTNEESEEKDFVIEKHKEEIEALHKKIQRLNNNHQEVVKNRDALSTICIERFNKINQLKIELSAALEMEEINLACYEEQKAKASKANAEKLKYMELVTEYIPWDKHHGKLLYEYNLWLKQRRKKKGGK